MVLISRLRKRLGRRTFVSLGANLPCCLAQASLVFFGHLTPAVEDLRHKHIYQPVPVEQRSPALAVVLKEIQSGRFGDGAVFQP